MSPAAVLYRPTDGSHVPEPREGYTELKAWHANRFGAWVVYVVAWPTENVVKVGMSCQSRWTAFQATGGRVLQLEPFHTKRAALNEEDYLLEVFANIANPVFPVPDAAAHLLGQHGAGFSECFDLGIGAAVAVLEAVAIH